MKYQSVGFLADFLSGADGAFSVETVSALLVEAAEFVFDLLA